jgi:NADH:ubiquinone oxidoreductase subunit 6 (subunit J)
MATVEIIFLALFTLVMAIIALEAERISRGIVALALTAFGIGAIYYLVDAIYAALFQLLLYAGVLTVLIMVVASTLTEQSTKKIEEKDQTIEEGKQ